MSVEKGKLADKRGELQKELEQAFVDVSKHEYCKEAVENLRSAFQEAKQAFPLKPKFILDRETRKIITMEYHELGAKKLTEVIEWFATYFGATVGETRGNSDRT